MNVDSHVLAFAIVAALAVLRLGQASYAVAKVLEEVFFSETKPKGEQ